MGKLQMQRLKSLLYAYATGSIRKEELEELVKLVQAISDDRDIAEAMDSIWPEIEADDKLVNLIATEKIYQRILADKRMKGLLLKADGSRFRIGIRAAIAIGIVLIGVLTFLFTRQPSNTKNKSVELVQTKPILPGNKKAILTLANGKQIGLDTLTTETCDELGGEFRKEYGKLVYITSGEKPHDAMVSKNTVSTPNGGEYELVLPDGTRVWLNAKSSLTYPTRFMHERREVALVGEAYFDVVNNSSSPFFVDANGTQVQVLGTEFNVAAYQEEMIIKTTLVEGAIRVENRMLKPGQQAICSPGSDRVKVENVDVSEATAWRKGYFYFDNEPLSKVMQTIARWYDFDVEYRGNLDSKTFGGTISKYEEFHKLLDVIALTGSVHFDVKGRRVMVSP